MQQTIDNRAARAELIVLRLEKLGYRFAVSGARIVYSKNRQLPPGKDNKVTRLLDRYRTEVCSYITRRGKANARKCRDIAGGKGV